MTQSLAELRRKILDRKDVKLEKHTRKPLPFADQPDLFPKTTKMRYIELRYHIRLELEIFKGSLDDVCRRLYNEVDRSTISRWRKTILKHVTFYGGKNE